MDVYHFPMCPKTVGTSSKAFNLDRFRSKGRAPLSSIPTNSQSTRTGTALIRRTTHQRPQPREPVAPPPPPAQHTRAEFNFVDTRVGDPRDVQDVTEYEAIIYRSMRQEELERPIPAFIQREITLNDRNMAIDALDRIHYKQDITTEALYRAIGILDRVLGTQQIRKSELNLMASACLLIASKIEDIYPARSCDFVTLSNNAFTQNELFEAEIKVLNIIGFYTEFPTQLFFLTHLMRISGQTQKTVLLARYLIEITTSNEQCICMKPSLVASAAVLLTRLLTNEENIWPSVLEGYTQYRQGDLLPCVRIMHSMLLQGDRQETRFMRRKYGSEHFLAVAFTPVPERLPF